MQIIILGDEGTKQELNIPAIQQDIIWVNDAQQLLQYSRADAYIDLLFDNTPERISLLQSLLPKPVIINSVIYTLTETNPSFIRINAWPTFLRANIIEASAFDESIKKHIEHLFQQLNKQMEWLPDEPGFITPRIISMIINEAYFTLSEGVSTKEEIDIAMKLGTNYPYGPFEWSEKIGLQNIVALLNQLSNVQKRYKPCLLLLQEASMSS